MQRNNQKQILQEMFIEQICKDCNCTFEDVCSTENVFTPLYALPGRRTFRDDDTLLKIICLNGKIICSAAESVLSECEALFRGASGAWFSQFSNLCKLEEVIAKEGYTINYAHHFYLPFGVASVSEEQRKQFADSVTLKWYEASEVDRFRGDKRYQYALSFLDRAPDMLAVTAEKDGEILGMCGVSRDSDIMWQIGIDVSPSARGQKIGPFLTMLMKEEVIKRGKLPFYGTAESHVQSQSVAVKSGFAPAWYELQTGRKNNGINLVFN